MKVNKYFICYLLFLSLFNVICAQTYIQPAINLGLNAVNNENNGNSFYPDLNEKVNPSYGIGVGIEHFFSDKFSSEVFFRYERLFLPTSGAEFYNLPVVPDGGLNYRYKFVKNQYILGVSLKFQLIKNLQMFSGLMYLQHGNSIVHHKLFQESFGKKAKIRTEKIELGVFAGLSYAISDRIICSLLAQKIIWQDENQDYLRLNSVFTISLLAAYRFKVLDKLKKKRKVYCPKL